MCDYQTLQTVRPVVKDLLASGTLFTSMDVTNRITGYTKHREIASGVREMFKNGEMSGYDRSLESMSGGEQAYVYHPQGENSAKYDTRSLKFKKMGDDGSPTLASPSQSVGGPATSAIPAHQPAQQPPGLASVTNLPTSQTSAPAAASGTVAKRCHAHRRQTKLRPVAGRCQPRIGKHTVRLFRRNSRGQSDQQQVRMGEWKFC
jgi:hypothetical protein